MRQLSDGPSWRPSELHQRERSTEVGGPDLGLRKEYELLAIVQKLQEGDDLVVGRMNSYLGGPSWRLGHGQSTAHWVVIHPPVDAAEKRRRVEGWPSLRQ